MQKFREQTQQEDRERVIQAMEEMAKKQAEESSVVYEGPITLGYLIKPMKRLHRCEKFKMKKEENGSRICLPCRNKRAS